TQDSLQYSHHLQQLLQEPSQALSVARAATRTISLAEPSQERQGPLSRTPRTLSRTRTRTLI
ncbi:hypothetical protein BGZ52_008146, partial [Haplosporangium bisporale]